MRKTSALMTRDELVDILDNTGPHKFAVYGESGSVEKDFVTLEEARPYPLTGPAGLKALPGERIRRIDAELLSSMETR